MVERGGRQIAALVHDPALDAEPDLVDLIAAGAGLPIENAQLQADLRSQFLYLQTVANTAPSLLVVIGTNGRIRNQNRATIETSGAGHDDALRGEFFWDVFIDESERDAMRVRFNDTAPDFPPSHYENAFTNARGERRVIEWGSAPVTDAAGRVTSIVAGGIEITERKQREVQLQRERDIAEALMQSCRAVDPRALPRHRRPRPLPARRARICGRVARRRRGRRRLPAEGPDLGSRGVRLCCTPRG